MLIIYLLTALMFIISLQIKLSLKYYTIVFSILSIIYLYFSINILDTFIINDAILKNDSLNAEIGLSIYEKLLIQYFPFFATASISLYLRYELEKSKNTINSLKEKLSTLDTKIHRILNLTSKVRKEKREIEKRLISDEKESIKIREIIYEISDFNISKIEENILDYYLRIIPSAKMSYYSFRKEDFKYKYSTYEGKTNILEKESEVFNFIKKTNTNLSSSLDYSNMFEEKILITIRLENNELFGVVVVEDIDFFDLNKITTKSLSYFTSLLSLQIRNSIIYQKQKETSFAYNDKDIYNLDFLKKMIDQEIAIAKRHSINSSMIIFKSERFKNLNKIEENKLFDKMEELYKDLFRTSDILFYNHVNSNFIFLLPLTPKENIDYILNKINSYTKEYDSTFEAVEINEKSEINHLNTNLGIN